uniref:AAA+ ATPase domain-containing protein n=1 Tax=viral metagenome TaxID=1070528 RepID=A0A6C0IS18_9ZZZZ
MNTETIIIHQSIQDKLQHFYDNKKIPNILFNGTSGSGKSTILNEFISKIYDNNKEKINDYVMYVNCAHGKGIKFIRDELKFFAKTNINSNGGNIFKSIVLLNGDNLTVDAQSALRRCIELFSHNTRFFIIVEDKYKLLRPILSRFCEIYVPEPIIHGKQVNLYSYNLENIFHLSDYKTKHLDWLKKELTKHLKLPTLLQKDLIELSIKLYEKSYSGLDIMSLIENGLGNIQESKKYELLVAFSKVKKEFRNEKLLIFFILHFLLLDNEYCLENLSFM